MIQKLRVLVACEFSGNVREEFRKLGHDVYSCDVYPTTSPSSYHLQCDVFDVLDDGWDLMIAFPPCTHLCVSGARHFKNLDKKLKQIESLAFFKKLLEAPISKIAVENPVGIVSTRIRKPDQIIQPYQFGHPVKKTTCLWLKNLPLLRPTLEVSPILISRGKKKWPSWIFIKRSYRDTRLRQSRSVLCQGIAKAMAEQWGDI